jgi:hypothetical protein
MSIPDSAETNRYGKSRISEYQNREHGRINISGQLVFAKRPEILRKVCAVLVTEGLGNTVCVIPEGGFILLHRRRYFP